MGWKEVEVDMETLELKDDGASSDKKDKDKNKDKTGKVVTNDADNPFEFFNGIELIPNTYYSYEGHLYVYLGTQRLSTTFEECENNMVQWDL